MCARYDNALSFLVEPLQPEHASSRLYPLRVYHSPSLVCVSQPIPCVCITSHPLCVYHGLFLVCVSQPIP
jgi:hypothetical protein